MMSSVVRSMTVTVPSRPANNLFEFSKGAIKASDQRRQAVNQLI
jgi:hypothetical protein